MKSDHWQSSDDDAIDEAAAEWLAEREDGFTAAQSCAFEQWCQRDPRHAAAVERLEKTCSLLKKLPLVRGQLSPANGPVLPAKIVGRDVFRRIPATRWWGGVAAAIAIGIFTWIAWSPAQQEERHVTTTGGYERVALKDGSILELNGDSNVHVRFSAQERSVTLAAGEAHFTVAHDATRPFVVRAGAVAVRAVGTAFSVRLAPADVEVLVTEGKVAVAAAATAKRKLEAGQEAPGSGAAIAGVAADLREEVGVNQRLVIPRVRPSVADVPVAPPVVEQLAPEAIRQALVWQERTLLFVDTPLREVAEQFNRRNRIQIVIADPALAARPVGGTFASNNVETFVRLLEESGDIIAEHRDNREIVLRKAR